MIDMKCIRGLFAGLLLFCSSFSQGQTTYGLVIGVADYLNHQKLQFADKDALEFYLYLTKASHADERNVFLFLNRTATREKIAEKFRRIVYEAREGDRIYIYFSGHGDTEQSAASDDFFLLLAGAPEKNYLTRPGDLLDKNFFDAYIQLLIQKRVNIIFICDACHAGSLVGGETGKKENADAIMRSWQHEIKMLSCLPNQSSQEGTKWGGGRSLFSYYLILGIKGLADKDGDGKVSVSELQAYLDDKVQPDAQSFGESQEPEIVGQKEFVISRTWPALVSEARQQYQANSSSEEYQKLGGARGTRLQIGNNSYIFKSTKPGSDKEYLDIEPGNSIADNYLRAIYYSFKEKLEAGSLVLPEDNSAYYYYTLFNQSKGDTILSMDMRTTLLTNLLDAYDDLLGPLYKGDSAAFTARIRSYDAGNLTLADTLAGNDLPLIARQIMARSLLLKASKLLPDSIAPAIDLLQRSIALDSLCPACYLELGQAHFSQQLFSAAVDDWKMYVQMLPNEEYGHNCLGRAYMALGQNDLAEEEFKKAKNCL
jgi:hypothetical protein